jgi:hypothetical protein
MSEDAAVMWKRARWKTLLLISGAMTMGAAGYWLLSNPDPAASAVFRWQVVLIALLCVSGMCILVVLGGLELVWPTTLIARSEGFELTGLWRHSVVPWSDVADFIVVEQPIPSVLGFPVFVLRHVGYRLTEDARARQVQKWRRWFGFGRYDSWLMSGIGKRPQEIADVLSAKRLSAQRGPDAGSLR